MCGIVGVLSHESVSSLEDTVRHMNDLQEHRGPDGEGVWSAHMGHVILGHRRLAIIDLSDTAAQPMHSVDGRFSLTYNGEIYNFKELRARCETQGSVFTTQSDSEVIIESIRQFGVEIISEFRGMWAFVLYDAEKNQAIMSRDPFGIKPLHYGFKDGVLYFASEIKSLRIAEPYFSEIDNATKELFLDHGYLDMGNWTFFEHVKRFDHAHYAVIDLSQTLAIEPICYWKPPKQRISIDEKEAIATLDDLLQQSVARHMVSDVPLAFCLSGGLDSSTTVGIADVNRSAGQSLISFTTHYPDYPEIDETKWAQKAVSHCHTDAHWVEPTYEQFKREFESVLYHHDEPFGSTSIYAQNSIFSAIHKEGLKVSLDGQGADEIFAGYHSYYYVLFRSLLKKRKFATLLTEAMALLIRFPAFFFDNFNYVRKALTRRSRFSRVKSEAYTKRLAEIRDARAMNDFHHYLVKTLTYTSIPQLLRNGDRCSMRHSVESRVPFLDIDLVNFVISLPDHYKIRRAVTKYLLRVVAKKYLPDELIDRKDKMGFPAPEKIWLKQGFGLEVSGTFSRDFREFIVKKWESVLKERQV